LKQRWRKPAESRSEDEQSAILKSPSTGIVAKAIETINRLLL